MKRSVPPLILLLLFLVPAVPAAAAISARFSFGPAIIGTGDLAAGIQGNNDVSARLYGPSLSGGLKAPGLGFEPSGEIVLHLGSRWGIGFGSGFSFFSGEGELAYAVGDVTVKEHLLTRLTAVPLQLNIHFFIPLSGRLSIDAWAGPGLYLTRWTWDYTMTAGAQGMSGSDRFIFKAGRPAFGGQAGLAVGLKLSNALDLTIEVSGRYASAGGFSGDWTETGSGDFWSLADSGQASAWAYDWMYDGKPFRQLSFQETAPEGESVKNARDARIELTGLGVRLGFRIRLPFGRPAERP